jgi:Predicted protease with the C-terminal PDZ domain
MPWSSPKGNRRTTPVDTRRLARDLKRICSAQIALFEPRSKRAPFAEYLFMVAPTAEGYGGLEHADSTALMCARRSLPHPRLQGRQHP